MTMRFPLPKPDLPALRRQSRMARVVTGLLGVLALVFQLLVPSFSSAAVMSGDAVWIEICSETGVAIIQVDANSGLPVEEAPCPDCGDCVFCAAASPGMQPGTANAECGDALCLTHWMAAADIRVVNPAQFWSHLRGPPLATQDIIVRAPRASMASIPVKGDAPWT